MASPPPDISVRFSNAILRPRLKSNRPARLSKRGGVCLPSTGRLHLPRKSPPTAPICSEILAIDNRWRRRHSCGAWHLFESEHQTPTEVPDMLDRVIVATAVYFDVPVISRDRRVRAASLKTVGKR